MKKSRPAAAKVQLKRSVAMAGRRTSVSLEPPFWMGLKEAAAARHIPVRELINEIAKRLGERDQVNLSSALRIFVLDFYRERTQRHDGTG